MYLMFMETTGW